EHEQGPASDAIDEEDRREGAAQPDAADDQPVDQRLLHIKMIDRAEQRRYPGGDAIGYEIGADPDKPHRDGTPQIDAPEQFDDARPRLRHFRQIPRQWRYRLAVARGGILDPRQSAIGLIVAALTSEPARRFRQYRAHGNSDQRRNSANDEHPPPAPIGHHVDTHQRDHQEPDGKQDLHRERKAAAIFRVREFIEIRRHQRNLATQADALNESHDPQLLVTLRRGAGQSTKREDEQRDQHAQPAAPAFGEPAEADGADQLAGKADPDQKPDLLRIE